MDDAGIDYGAILEEAEKEADVIVWDGGNNDTPFYKPDLWICVADPHRPGHEFQYFPGTYNFQHADIILIGKVGYADEANINLVQANATRVNPGATVIFRESPLDVPDRGWAHHDAWRHAVRRRRAGGDTIRRGRTR